MAVKNLGPLVWNVPLFNRDGTPTPEFQRRWALQINNNSQIPGVVFGTGAPSGSASGFYFDKSTTPYTLYIGGTDGLWHKADVTKFTELSDAPSSYAGKGRYLVRVNVGTTALEFVTLSQELDDGLGLSQGNIAMRGSTTWGVLADANDATKFLNGAHPPAYAAVKDSDLSLSNITTNNVSTSKHGFAPILPNDATKYLDGTGAYTVPAGGGGGGDLSVYSQVLGSTTASVTVTLPTSGYKNFEIYVNGRSTVAATADNVIVQFNGDTAANYWIAKLDTNASGQTGVADSSTASTSIKINSMAGNTAPAGDGGQARALITNYTGTSFYKQLNSHATYNIDNGTNQGQSISGGGWRNTAAITTVKIFLVSGSFAAGTYIAVVAKPG